MQMEGAPGVSLPVTTSSGNRRFVLKPAQLDDPPLLPTTVSTAINPQSAQKPRVIPRWRAGMLQRQISKKNLQRRVRAFSLSDVQSDMTDKSTGISPLAFDKSKTITTLVGQRDYSSKLSGRPPTSSTQKTVTIVSPEHRTSSSRASNSMQGSSVRRGYSESEADVESMRSQYLSTASETSGDNISQFTKEASMQKKSFDNFSKSPPEFRSSNTNPFTFKMGSDDDEISTMSEMSRGVVNPRFLGLKNFSNSHIGMPKLETVYSDDRISCRDQDQSDDSFTSECVIALKRKSSSNVQDTDERIDDKQASFSETTPRKRKNQSIDPTKCQSEISTRVGDEKTSDRKISIVSIEPWSEVNEETVTYSQKGSKDESSNLVEVKVEKPASSDKFKSTIEVAVDEGGSLMEVKVEDPQASS